MTMGAFKTRTTASDRGRVRGVVAMLAFHPIRPSLAGFAATTSVLACFALIGCTAPTAVQPARIAPRVPHVGYLTPVGAAPPGVVQRSPSREAFVQGLAELGYVEGQNIVIDNRLVTDGEEAKLPELARELADMPVDVIVALGGPRVEAAKQATDTIPIVMASVVDPVDSGLVPSLSRPGTNVTGVATRSGELAGKRLEILKRAVPHL